MKKKIYEEEAFFPAEGDIPELLVKDIPFVMDKYLAGGTLKVWEGPYREVFSPVLARAGAGVVERSIGRCPLMTEKESLEALQYAKGAFDNGRGEWPAMTAEGRMGCMEEFLSRMVLERDRVTHLLMWEIGKSVGDAQTEFDRTVNYVRGVMGALREAKKNRSLVLTGHNMAGRIGRAPLGVVLCMGPFNYPLFETFTGLASGLLTGNTVVFKLPRFGSLLYGPLFELFRDSFPPGVVNVISGEGKRIIPPLLATGMVDGLAFIGTSGVAAYLRGLHPKPQRLRCVLGLEAKNPAIILSDADLDLVVPESVKGALAFNGQRCAALKIFFVHTSLVEPFLERFSRALADIEFGMPWEEGVFVTPLVEPGKPRYLADLMEDAVGRGARLMNEGGGTIWGTFFHPALLFPVTPAMRVYHEEQFGPLIPVVPYDDLEVPVRYVTESSYGQQASVFGKDKDRLRSLVDCLVHQVSRVNINCQCQRSPDTAPFTGRKDSAEGSLSVSDAATAFTTPFFVASRDTEADVEIVDVLIRERER